jgi:hypothetical protein
MSTTYVDELEPMERDTEPSDAPPEWLSAVETTVVETSSGKVLYQSNATGDEPAPACNTEIRANEWRVRDLTSRYMVFHRSYACDSCGDYSSNAVPRPWRLQTDWSPIVMF